MTSLQKDVENIKNKVFYIDRKVNPYFNVQINNLIKTIYDLDKRVKDLENNKTNVESNSEDKTFLNNSNDGIPFNEKKNTKKQTTKKSTNDIRTISIE